MSETDTQASAQAGNNEQSEIAACGDAPAPANPRPGRQRRRDVNTALLARAIAAIGPLRARLHQVEQGLRLHFHHTVLVSGHDVAPLVATFQGKGIAEALGERSTLLALIAIAEGSIDTLHATLGGSAGVGSGMVENQIGEMP